jgi:hypothetical protein
MSKPWRGDAIRRGLAAELGQDVADRLEELADGVLQEMDADVTFEPETERNSAIAFLTLTMASDMREET